MLLCPSIFLQCLNSSHADVVNDNNNSNSPDSQRKRPSSSCSETPVRKRLRKETLNTPTRLFVQTTLVKNVSAVAVRDVCCA